MYYLWESMPLYDGDGAVWPHYDVQRRYTIVASGTLLAMIAAHNAHESDDPDMEYHIRNENERPWEVPTIYRNAERD